MKAAITLGLGILVAFAACKSTTEGTGTSGGSGGTGTDPTCVSRCTSKAVGCGVTRTVADDKCSAFCPVTSNALSCLEATSCATIGATAAYRNLCPSGTTSSSTTSSGAPSSSGTSSSGNLGTSCTDSFECNGFTKCICNDGFDQGTAPNECIGNTCAPDCTFTCENHGGI